MKLKITSISLLFLTTLTISNYTFAATEKYVTDIFEVTMRSGTSTSNNILQLLKSGELVTILEEEVDTKYSLVETEAGKQGYVLNRYLVDSPTSKHELTKLQIKSTEQLESIALLQSEIEKLQFDLETSQSHSSNLQSTLLSTENELARVRNAAENTLSIADENEELKVKVNQLTRSQSVLSGENAALKDTSDMDWFLRGAGVSLIAFLLGILITRIRWKKRDSWGSY